MTDPAPAAAPATFDVSKLLNQVAPRDYDGKSAQEGLCFLGSAKIYSSILANQNVNDAYCWMAILNKLTDSAAAWAGPHIVTAAGTSMPWDNFEEFEEAFKAHFCAADDEQSAISGLVKLCKSS